MNKELESVSNRKARLAKSSQEEKGFLPTIMTRLSPFFPGSNHHIGDEKIAEPIVLKNQWGKITVIGNRLSIYDETVLLGLLALLKKHGTNTFETTTEEICKLISVKPRKGTYDAIMKSLHRMSEAHITIEKSVCRSNDAEKVMDGSIITGITKNEEPKKLILELNSYLLSSFGDRFITRMDIKLRSDLHGDISKALYRFYEGQRLNCNSISIMKLCKAINMCCNGSMYSLRMKLRKAMRELETEGYLRRFILPKRGEVVAVFRSSNRFLNNYIWAINDGKIERKVVGR